MALRAFSIDKIASVDKVIILCRQVQLHSIVVILVKQVCSFLAGARAPTLLALHMLRYEHLRLYSESLAVAMSMLLLVLSPI